MDADTPRMPGRTEFVLLMAALMASNAMAIDAMLPALPAIGEALGVARDNDRQLVITFFLLGYGLSQVAFGPLADRLGRKRLLVGCLLAYAAFGALSGLAGSMALLLAARFTQGIASGGLRVLVVAVIRDRFHGAAMARIMSSAMIVFMIVPVLAPSFGQAVLAVANWRWIFALLAAYGLWLAVWSAFRLPETLAVEDRRALSVRTIGAGLGQTLRRRESIGNTLAATLAFGGLFAFIGSIQQIVFDVFHRPELMGLVFAAVAGPMALSSYANMKLVMRAGPRLLLLRALTALTGIAIVHLVIALVWGESLWSFIALQALTMACFGLVGANSSALAMSPLGHIAGTASALQGLITTIGGALIGLVIGQMFDGTTIPLITGFAIGGALALPIAIWANAKERAAPSEEETALASEQAAEF
ncbi:MAG TPA: multidrug effflux MFS transporter [Allosphingosinicella sp.]|nr:multidrug effflux MFS transporter [Allosphingosinicella sp.]